MNAEENLRITSIHHGTPGGALLRRYWQPVALVDEFDAAVDPVMGLRPVKALRILGEDLVLFRDATGAYGLLHRRCPHRGADLSFGRLESAQTSRWGTPSAGLRCPFHGWKFAVDGQCLDTPAEPEGSRVCSHVRARAYPVQVRGGVVLAFMGDGDPPPLPRLDALAAPDSHAFAFKGLWNCNWLQAQEVGLDPAHTSFLHAFFEDEDLAGAYGRQFRNASAGTVDGQQWPMTKIMREFHRPEIRVEPTAWGQRITTLRRLSDALMHVRVTHGLFPNGFVIPLSETMTITQFHVPIDDQATWWFSLFTSFADPVDKDTMRTQRLRANPAPDFAPISGAHNRWGYDAVEQASKTLLGMGEDDINVHDQWACESMGVLTDRTQEHLGSTDRAIALNRRALRSAIDQVAAGAPAPGLAAVDEALGIRGPDTVDGIAPADRWEAWWREEAARKIDKAPWKRPEPIQANAAVDRVKTT